MEDESMSVICFRTAPKGDLPHYSFIYNLDTLGKYTRKVACYSLGDMLYLNIQNVKVTIKTEEFQQKIGVTVFCIKRRMMAKKGCLQLAQNDT